MAMDIAEIERLIKEGVGFNGSIRDLRGDSDHYAAFVTSAQFEGLTG